MTIISGAALAGCSTLSGPAVKGAIIPHHLFVEHHIDKFYAEISDPSIEKIILISPDHFNHGFHYVRTHSEVLAEDSRIPNEHLNFEKEHGLTAHYAFLEKYFPKAELVEVMFKQGTPQENLNKAVESLIDLGLQHALVIGSIDFTHLEKEEIALKNDERTIDYLESWTAAPELAELNEYQVSLGGEIEGAVAYDSSESLYVLGHLMAHQNSLHFELWERTSSGNIIPGLPAEDNTSHVFGTFSSN